MNRHFSGSYRVFPFYENSNTQNAAIYLREAHFTLCVSDRWDPCLLSVCLLLSVRIFLTNCHGAARGWPRCGPVVFWTKWTEILKITVFGPVSNTTYPSYLGIGGLENGHCSLFLDQFQTRLSLHMAKCNRMESNLPRYYFEILTIFLLFQNCDFLNTR